MHRPKCAAIAFFLAFVSMFLNPAAFAMELKAPMSVEQLDVDFRQYGEIALLGNGFDYVAINLTTPQEMANQKIFFASSATFMDDAAGNRKLAIRQESPEKSLRYSVRGTAKINAVHTYSLPASYTIPESAKQYLFPTASIQSDNPKIRALAKEITRGASTDFERSALLAIWVNANVNYTLELEGEAKDALWVLEHRIGTCDEFSALFIALARSIGIPAKYVSGYVFGPDGWQKHAWAEAYIGKWVPVDATWLEAGRLDATHIKFFETADNYVANEAKAYGVGAGKITWVEDETSLEATNYREAEFAEFEAFASAEKLGGGKDIVVVARISSDEFALDKITLEPCIGAAILDVGSKPRNVILQPKKQSIVWWKISVNHSLDSNKVYTCPMVLNSNIFRKKTLNFVLDPRVKTDSRIDASIEKTYFDVGENVKVRVTDDGLEGATNIGIIADDFFDESEVTSSSASLSFSIQANSPGNRNIVVYDSAGSAKVLGYVVQETGNLSIERFDAPDLAMVNTRPEARVMIKNRMHTPQSVRLDAKTGGRVLPSESITIPPMSGIAANISIPADAAGRTTLTVRLVSDSVEEATKSILIYDAPELLFDAGYNPGTRKAEVWVTSRKDEAKNITVILAGKEEFLASSLEGRALYFDVPAGEYQVTAKYQDAAGKHYRAEGKIVLEESWWEKIIYWIKSVPGRLSDVLR